MFLNEKESTPKCSKSRKSDEEEEKSTVANLIPKSQQHKVFLSAN